jgi:hypothetical protein
MEILLFWIGCAIATGVVARHKGRSVVGWVLLSLCGAVLALLLMAVLPSREAQGARDARISGTSKEFRVCPTCDEVIRKAAVKCRYCHTPVTAHLPTPSTAWQW